MIFPSLLPDHNRLPVFTWLPPIGGLVAGSDGGSVGSSTKPSVVTLSSLVVARLVVTLSSLVVTRLVVTLSSLVVARLVVTLSSLDFESIRLLKLTSKLYMNFGMFPAIYLKSLGFNSSFFYKVSILGDDSLPPICAWQDLNFEGAQYGHIQSEKKLGVGDKYHRSIKVHT